MKTLEPKYVVPYLLHNLKCQCKIGPNVYEGILVGIEYTPEDTSISSYVLLFEEFGEWDPKDVRPFLHPLDLTKEIEHNGEKFVPIEKLGWNKNLNYDSFKSDYMITDSGTPSSPIELSYYEWQKFFEWHLDVFGLIPAGLAIKKKTL